MQKKDLNPAERPAWWHLAIFRLGAFVLIPLSFFILIELALRLCRFGDPGSAIVEEKQNGIVYLHGNPRFGYRFFPKSLAREFTPFRITVQKPDKSYRIFILGGSAAQGTPDPAFSFGRILDVLLKTRYPAGNFEVITAAMPAINSHVVLEIAKDCLRYKPDLLVVYMGHNEVVGPYGPGTVFSPFFNNLSLLRLIVALKATKTAQLLSLALEKLRVRKESFSRWQGMEMFLAKQIRHDDPALNTTYSHFAKNLQELNQLSQKKGVKLIYCTVGSNLKDCPPFTSLHRNDLSEEEEQSWQKAYTKGTALEASGSYAAAIEAFLHAARIDSVYAELQFRLGRCYWIIGHYLEARQRFKRALELDTNRFRGDDRINEIIRIAAQGQANTVYLADALAEFEKNSPHGIPGNELFLEHVHLNFKGNHILAKTVFDQIEVLLPNTLKDQKAEETTNMGEALCAEYLAYNAVEQYKIAESVLNNFIRRPPFTNQLHHSETVEEMEKTLDSLKNHITKNSFDQALRDYEEAIRLRPSDWWLHWKYAGLLASTDVMQYQQAAVHFQFVRNALPQYADAYLMLGLVMGKLGRLYESIMFNQKALEINPTIAEAYFNLGLAYQMQGNIDLAIANYQKTLSYQPAHPRAHNNLAVIYYRQGQAAKAIATLNEGLKFTPEDMELHYNLAIMLSRTGKKEEAVFLLIYTLGIFLVITLLIFSLLLTLQKPL